jgi:hypothetical protein
MPFFYGQRARLERCAEMQEALYVKCALLLSELNQSRKLINIKSTIFWDITPCSALKVNRRFGGTCRLHFQGRRIGRVRNQRGSKWQASTLKMGLICPTETSADFQRTTRRYIPGDNTLHNHRCESLKSYITNIR